MSRLESDMLLGITLIEEIFNEKKKKFKNNSDSIPEWVCVKGKLRVCGNCKEAKTPLWKIMLKDDENEFYYEWWCTKCKDWYEAIEKYGDEVFNGEK